MCDLCDCVKTVAIAFDNNVKNVGGDVPQSKKRAIFKTILSLIAHWCYKNVLECSFHVKSTDIAHSKTDI